MQTKTVTSHKSLKPLLCDCGMTAKAERETLHLWSFKNSCPRSYCDDDDCRFRHLVTKTWKPGKGLEIPNSAVLLSVIGGSSEKTLSGALE